MDIIFLHDFKAKTLIGIYPWERKVRQTVRLDLEIALPTSKACQSDQIDNIFHFVDAFAVKL